ncbi:MAG: MBL fold metallo-hydrolase RNA specificity domain-containing protein, partial [Candidatus Desulfacyla sp.]
GFQTESATVRLLLSSSRLSVVANGRSIFLRVLCNFIHHFQEWDMKRWSLFLDSPMAIEATEVYSRHPDLFDAEARKLYSGGRKPFSPPNLHISRTPEESMAINRIHSGAIVIAGSGMCEGGRIKHHFKHNIWRSNCHVIIVGFQVAGTLGRRLVDGAKQIKLWGETVNVAAQIHTLGGFSAHADQQGLLDWYGAFKDCPPLVLVHGESKARETLAHMSFGGPGLNGNPCDPETFRALGCPLCGGRYGHDRAHPEVLLHPLSPLHAGGWTPPVHFLLGSSQALQPETRSAQFG